MMRFILLFLWSSWVWSATVVFNNGFESGNLTGIICSGNCPGVNAASKFSGTYGGDFDLTRSMTTTYRTEIDLGNPGQFIIGNEYWLGYNFRYEDWAIDSDAEISGNQVHLVPQDWNTACAESAYSNAPLMFVSKNDQLSFITYGGNTRWTQALQHNTWQSAVIRFIPSRTSSGLIELWMDGVKVVSLSGQNIDTADGCGRPYQDISYIKLGVYKWTWANYTTQSTRRRMFIDNIKVAAGASGFNDVYTPVSNVDTTPPVPNNLVATPTATSAVFTWTTDEPADSTINYGTTTGYGQTVYNSALVTSHSVTVTGLTPSTLYNYRFQTKDAAGNNYLGANHQFTTLSNSPPVITNEANTNITATGATITWDTIGSASDSYVYYGTTAAVSSNTGSATLVTNHSVTLSGLTAKTHYFRKVCSTNAVPLTACGPITTFDTKTTSGIFSDLFN